MRKFSGSNLSLEACSSPDSSSHYNDIRLCTIKLADHHDTYGFDIKSDSMKQIHLLYITNDNPRSSNISS